MTFWRKVLFWLVPLFIGRAMNLWQIQVYGFMPIYTFWGDWIPVSRGEFLAEDSIGGRR